MVTAPAAAGQRCGGHRGRTVVVGSSATTIVVTTRLSRHRGIPAVCIPVGIQTAVTGNRGPTGSKTRASWPALAAYFQYP